MASKLGDVLDALETRLETAVSGTVYEPDLVQQVLFWPTSESIPEGVKTFYLLALGERSGVTLDSCHVTDRVEVLVMAATRATSASEDPFRESPARLSVALDLEADVLAKLRGDQKLTNGGDAEVLTVFDAPPVTQFQKYDPGWVIVEITLQISYYFGKDER